MYFPLFFLLLFLSFFFTSCSWLPSATQENTQKLPIKITIGGDIMLSRMVGFLNQKEGFDRITKKYNPISQTGGIVLFNLESPFSLSSRDSQGSSYYFGAHTGSVETLTTLKGDNTMILSLANNHIRNSGDEGIKTTTSLLKKHDILYNGIGTHSKNSEKITQTFIHTYKVCSQSFSYDGGKYSYVYINKTDKSHVKKSLISMKKNKCDLKILSFHWGKEYRYSPTKKQIDLAHFSIDHGADMIVGHHSHIFGMIETYKKKPIYYSLGNYIFDQDTLINNCSKYTDCIYDIKHKKKVLPVQIGVSYELLFQGNTLIKSTQKKHRLQHFGEIVPF